MKSIKKNIKAIIFDMDGTIIKTEHIWNKVTRDVIALHGIHSLTSEQEKEMERLIGSSLPKASNILKEIFDFKASVDEILSQHIVLSNNHLSKQRCDFIEGFQAFHKKLIEHAIPNSIATNAHRENLDGMVKINGLDLLFGKYIYSPRDVGELVKPDPALFLHASKNLGVAPEQCVVFEDSVYGFQAAKAAGMRCIAVKNDKNKLLLDHVDGAIDSYDQALEALKKL